MAHHHVVKSTSAAATGESQGVERYLTAIGEQLHGPARARAAVTDELRAGLTDAIAAGRSQGMSAAEASNKAITQLGTPRIIAAAFAGELALRQIRKLLWLLLLTGPLVGIWWFLLFAAPSRNIQPATVVTAIPALPIVAAGAVTAIGVLATTGSLIRWLPESSPRRAALAVGLFGCAILAVDTTMLLILATRVLTGTAGSLSPIVASIAATASIARLPFAASVVLYGVRTHRRMLPK
jgi:hypothetical protein